jgi:hypothetical protein
VERRLVLEKGRLKRYRNSVKTLSGHFDGKVIVLDEPADLPPNTKVKIIASTGGDSAALVADFAVLSERVFKKIWDNPLDADYDAL